MIIHIRSGDGQTYQIRSGDLDLIARWIIETIDVIRPDQILPAMIDVWPDIDPRTNQPDWITDARVLGGRGTIRQPRDVIDYLAGQLARLEELRGTPG